MGPVAEAFHDHIKLAGSTVERLAGKIEEAGRIMTASFSSGGKAVLFGNGGSAADALHLEGELLGRFKIDREGLPAVALGGGPCALTAVANDYSYDTAFSRLAKAHLKKGDVAILFSTSGNSSNIIETAKTARQQGAIVICFTGLDGGKLRDHADLLLDVPSSDVPRIQEMHLLISHALCEIVEKALF